VRWPAINTAVDSRKEVRGLPGFGSKKIRNPEELARFEPIAAIGSIGSIGLIGDKAPQMSVERLG
jgi:hypothetical protein